MKTLKFKVTLSDSETMNFDWDETRPIVKRIFTESYILDKELINECIENFLDVPPSRFENENNLDPTLKRYMNLDEQKEFVKKNNRIFDFWQKTKSQVEEWLKYFDNGNDTTFRHFTLNLDDLSWCNHTNDTPCDPDRAFIDIEVLV